MLKVSVYCCLLTGLLTSCTTAIRNDRKGPAEDVPAQVNSGEAREVKHPGNARLVVRNEDDIIGYWVGMFEPDKDAGYIAAGEGFYWDYANKINIFMERIENGKVYGRSIVAGNDRPFTGHMTLADSIYTFVLKEPGDDKYDGVFTFSISNNDSLLSGTWHAYKPVRIQGRKYILQKRIFHYDPEYQMDYGRYINWQKTRNLVYNKAREEGDYDVSYFTTTEDLYGYNASARLLTVAEVSNMKKGDLFILRNAIYARHGYSFKNRQLRVYFDQQPWYIPVTTDMKAEFTTIEKKNIELLLRYEKHAKEYYDVFGRG